MNVFKALLRDFKIKNGIIPSKVVTLSNGVVLKHHYDKSRKVTTVKIA